MGYLNNQVVTVDAILTTKGRELLARGDGSFNIRAFALSDDEIDYTLYNPTNPSGSAYYGEAIQNMPLLEAFPDETQMMKYKLVTLPRDTAKMPVVTAGGVSVVTLKQTGQITITPQTLNYLGNNSVQESSGYSFTVSDVRQFASQNGVMGQGITTDAAVALNAVSMQTNGTNVSRTVIGMQCVLTATGVSTLFGAAGNTTATLYSLLSIIGLDSGARIQIPIQITRT
jgi:hypothetical protein|tara:strand:- start:4405 stop:5088 length:684 start_codon:yes stop_codon:yes gene_type:complete